jgi:hypothetical protein
VLELLRIFGQAQQSFKIFSANKKAADQKINGFECVFLLTVFDKIGAQKRTRTSTMLLAST